MPAMRNALRIVWMSLVLLIVALTSALVAMQLAVHGHEVRVPDLRGKTPAEARQIVDVAGLNVQIERQYFSPVVAEGRVLSQMPEPGSTVRRGWDVRLALSLGPQRVSIPQVVGASQRAATITINQRGLDLGSVAGVEIRGVDSGQVVGQDPPANASDVSSPKIGLLVAQDPTPEAYVMPSFIGQPLGSVTNVLKDAGFSIGKSTMAQAQTMNATEPTGNDGTSPQSQASAASGQPTPVAAAAPTPASIVVSQEPAPGEKVLAGSAINFVVR
jgi:beta-lactam-binding protein with PASTA domain